MNSGMKNTLVYLLILLTFHFKTNGQETKLITPFGALNPSATDSQSVRSYNLLSDFSYLSMDNIS